MKVIVSAKAREDLIAIRAYIRDELSNPEAARKLMADIKVAIASFADFPAKGAQLGALIPIQTDFRYLVCGGYLVFYRQAEQAVHIVRVLHSRRDTIKARAIAYGIPGVLEGSQPLDL